MRVFGQSHSRNLCFGSSFSELQGVWQRLGGFLEQTIEAPANLHFYLLHLSRPPSVLCHLFIVFPTPFLAYLAMHPFKLNIPGPNKHSAVILCRFTSWIAANLSQSQKKLSIFFPHMQKTKFLSSSTIQCLQCHWFSCKDTLKTWTVKFCERVLLLSPFIKV